jgi:hypothetical protein
MRRQGRRGKLETAVGSGTPRTQRARSYVRAPKAAARTGGIAKLAAPLVSLTVRGKLDAIEAYVAQKKEEWFARKGWAKR